MRIKINNMEIEASEEDIKKLLGMGQAQGPAVPVEVNSNIPIQAKQPEPTPPGQARAALELIRDSGLSFNTIVMISRNILKVETTGKLLEDSYEHISSVATPWLNRPIRDTFSTLFISKIKVGLGKALAVIGLNSDNQIVVLGIEDDSIYEVLNRIRARGLRSNSVKLVVLPLNDDMDDAVTKIFPACKIQRDWGSVIDEAPPPVRESIRKLMNENSVQETMTALKKSDAKEFVEPHIDSLLTYFESDRRLWRVLRTLSCIYRLEEEIRIRSKMAETPEEIKLLVTWSALRLQYHWIKYPVDSPLLNNLRYMKGKDQGASSGRVPTQKSNIRRRSPVQKER